MFVMKINDTLKNTVSVATDKAGSGKTSSAKTPSPQATENKSSDSVTLSPMYAKLQSLEEKMSTDKVFDPEKVEAIKSAISSGSFNVSSDKIADGLIETVKDLLYSKPTK
jgi:negative regulator of flagellin synthesis FlgM